MNRSRWPDRARSMVSTAMMSPPARSRAVSWCRRLATRSSAECDRADEDRALAGRRPCVARGDRAVERLLARSARAGQLADRLAEVTDRRTVRCCLHRRFSSRRTGDAFCIAAGSRRTRRPPVQKTLLIAAASPSLTPGRYRGVSMMDPRRARADLERESSETGRRPAGHVLRLPPGFARLATRPESLSTVRGTGTSRIANPPQAAGRWRAPGRHSIPLDRWNVHRRGSPERGQDAAARQARRADRRRTAMHRVAPSGIPLTLGDSRSRRLDLTPSRRKSSTSGGGIS